MNSDDTSKEAEILAELSRCTGTEAYRAHSPIMLTDGAYAMAELCKAFWLMDVVASWQTANRVACERFQVWKISVKGKKAVVTATGRNNRTIATQKIKHTDFPLPSAKLFLVNDGRSKVLMTANEYHAIVPRPVFTLRIKTAVNHPTR